MTIFFFFAFWPFITTDLDLLYNDLEVLKHFLYCNIKKIDLWTDLGTKHVKNLSWFPRFVQVSLWHYGNALNSNNDRDQIGFCIYNHI